MARIAPVLMTLLSAACEPSASMFGPGLHLQLRVGDAQLHRGSIPEDQGGPAVSQVQRPQPGVVRGDATVGLNGRLAPGGVALHLQAVGDPDHWVLPADGFDFVIADELLYSTQLEFSYAIQTEMLEVRLAAADEDGRLGPVTTTSFTMLPDVPPARLLVALAWDSATDVNLHVRDPEGVVIGAKNISSYELPVGGIPDPEVWMNAAYLDYDSNQECELDLRNRENVLWLNADPMPGTYRVYAHLYAPCDASFANMLATVHLHGDLVAEVGATQYAFDSRVHWVEGEAPGLLMAEFEVP